MQAVIIAAGNGHRLRRNGNHPKPLHKVAGISLIERTILSAKKGGIAEFVIVVGYRAQEIRSRLSRREKGLGVKIEFVENSEWEKGNGFSVLAARSKVTENFLLLMSDHLFDWRILPSLLKEKVSPGEVLLGIDPRIQEIFDLPDATKVQTENGSIRRIGKEIGNFDAIDTGIFLCSPALFEALETVCRRDGSGLSDGIQFLASQGKARVFDIGNRYWQDVDTPEGLRHAEKILFQSVRKETDGVVSRYLNRYISGFLTRIFLRTPITANQITWSALVIGLLSGFLVSRGDWRDVALGGFLFQLASIYDGCDGEISKLKLTSSKFGEWLDTLCDNTTYIAFFIGVVVGAHRQGYTYLLPLGVMMVVGVVLFILAMYYYLLQYTNSGSLVTVHRELLRDIEDTQQNWFVRWTTKTIFMIKRDFFALAFMFLCFLNRLDLILILTAIGANSAWIFLLTIKKEFLLAKVKTEPLES